MEDNTLSFPTLRCPECPTAERQVKSLTDENNLLELIRVVEDKFSEYVANNLIGALSDVGSIHHPDNFISMSLPYFWCNFCDFKCVQKADITEHLQLHRFRCKFCEYEVFSRCEVVKHTLKYHSDHLDDKHLWFCMIKNDLNIYKQTKTSPKIKRSTNNDCNSDIPPKKIKVENAQDDAHNDFTGNMAYKGSISPDLLQERMKPFQSLSSLSKEVNTDHQNTCALEVETIKKSVPSSTDLITIAPLSTRQTHNTESLDSPQQSSQSYLRSILTTNTTSIINTNLPVISQNVSPSPSTVPSHSKNNNLISSIQLEPPAHPNIKIEIDDDTYSNHLSYIPKTWDPVPSRRLNSDVPLLNQTSTVAETDFPLIESHQGATFNKEVNENGVVLKNTSVQSLHLPILRTMLTSKDKTPKLSLAGRRVEVVGDLSSEESSTDDKDDSDYCPNISSDDEEFTQARRRSRRKKATEPSTHFTCINCREKGLYASVKNHLLLKHKPTNLVLRDTIKNSFVYICPSYNCDFRDKEFKAFIQHLELCGVFTYKTMTGMHGRTIQTAVLVTLKNILERSLTGWVYACRFCAMRFATLSESQKHKWEKHSNCFDINSVFKLCERTKKLVILCTLCLSEIHVLKWSEMVFQTCTEHTSHCLKSLENQSTLQQPQKSINISDNSQPNTTKVDSTPALRAMLCQNPSPRNEYTANSENEDLPASRMLQWLISEGSRMMHMLK